MRKHLTWFIPLISCVAFLTTGVTPIVHADAIQANCSPGDCGDFSAYTIVNQPGYDQEVAPAPAIGTWQATSSSGLVYSLTFTTGIPTSSTQNYFYNPYYSPIYSYYFTNMSSTYGEGGTVQITGPGGFSFSGTFIGGTYGLGGDFTDPDGLFQGESLNMNFSGMSADGREWLGNLDLAETIDTGEESGGFTLTSTPEPSSFVLFLFGLGTIIVCSRKKRAYSAIPAA